MATEVSGFLNIFNTSSQRLVETILQDGIFYNDPLPAILKRDCLKKYTGGLGWQENFELAALPVYDIPRGGASWSLSPSQKQLSTGCNFDIRSKINAHTKAIVLINPNNPTGALYPDDLLHEIIDIARKHHLTIYADEVYDKVLYDGEKHTSIASLAEDVLMITFNGLSKNYRSCGYRAGWMVVSGDKRHAKDYIEGLDMLASMRLCANAPGQHGIQTALGGYQSIDDLIKEGGRLRRQRDIAHELISAIPGVSCVKPKAALYMFPKLDPAVYPIKNDQQFISELLQEEKVLLVQGTGFNWPHPDHFRLVFLPHEDDLREAIGRIARFLENYRKRHNTNQTK